MSRLPFFSLTVPIFRTGVAARFTTNCRADLKVFLEPTTFLKWRSLQSNYQVYWINVRPNVAANNDRFRIAIVHGSNTWTACNQIEIRIIGALLRRTSFRSKIPRSTRVVFLQIYGIASWRHQIKTRWTAWDIVAAMATYQIPARCFGTTN